MKKMISAALGAALATTALVAPTAAHAGSADGKWQVKVLGTGVLPDGKIDEIKSIDTTTTLGGALAATPGADVKANDNVVPTLAVEYFFTPNFSAETICCFTSHHVDGDKGLAGAGRIVDHVLILPATLTLKAHMPLGPIKPYVGAGPAVFFVFGEKPGDTAKALDIAKVRMSNSLGVALQGGVDIALGDKGFGISLDAKKYFMKPTAKFYDTNGDLALETKHKLDPWVLSAGVTYRF